MHLIRILMLFLTSKVRDEAAVVRQEGAKRNGSERVNFNGFTPSLLFRGEYFHKIDISAPPKVVFFHGDSVPRG